MRKENRHNETEKPAPPSQEYMKWFNQFPLRPIESDGQHEYAMAIASNMLDKWNKLNEDEKAYFQMLKTAIKEYERKCRNWPECSTGRLLEFLMEQHDLTQKELVEQVPALGSQAAVSYILSDKRKPTRQQIEGLAKRFNVSTDLFFREIPREQHETVLAAAGSAKRISKAPSALKNTTKRRKKKNR